MKTLLRFLAAGMLLVSSVAYAGFSFVGQFGVEINSDDQWARGITTTARFSDDPEEHIGCGVRHTLIDGVLDSWGFCQASISPDIYVNCIALNAELIDKIAGLNSFSFVEFNWDENGECTHFGFSTQSGHIPGKEDMKK